MKRLELFPFLALLLLALDSSEASSLPRGRSKTKKLQGQASEVPYVCLDSPAKLPNCNFNAEANDETLAKPSRQLRSLDTLAEPKELLPIGETEVTHRATTIIYKIEGCIPSRLPFVLPLCKREDSVGRVVEVRRLFPFKVTGPSAQNSGVLPTLVFPEVDMNQWHRFMQGPWVRPTDNDDNVTQSAKATRQITEEKQSEVVMKKTTKRKKTEKTNFNDEKPILQKFTEGFASKEIDENNIFSKFPSRSAVEQQLANDRARDTDSYKTRSSRLNRIVDASQEDGEIGRHVVEKAFSTQHRHEFPYAEAIPYDAEKLRVARLSGEFPSARAILYDPEKLQVARINSEFPYSRAIPYDPMKLQVAKRGSEFPYARTIPYDPKKLEERRSAAHDAPGSLPFSSWSPKVSVAEAKAQNPKVVPFDTSMLDAAKEGGIFPYRKAIPGDTSKIVDTMEFSKSTVPEKMQVPVRHVKMFRDEELSTYARKLPSRNDQTRLEKVQAGREFQKNLINSWNGKVEPSSTYGRFGRRAMESDSSGDTSSVSDSLEISSRWSEFPYSKAIPFDPEKLRWPRSSMEYYLDSSVAIPQDFPYAKAIPYDSWKLASIRRKKSESQVDATMHD